MKLLLEAESRGYTTNQTGHTMTVGELIEYLSQYDEDEKIYVSNDNGYTYGRINEDMFREEDEDEE